MNTKSSSIEIIMGSESDWSTMQSCYELLQEFSIDSSVTILSAHRTPKALSEYVEHAECNGTQVFIAGAGLNASLAGCIAALTIRPVIAVPISSDSLNGIDSLLASSQMPSGIPVATMSIGNPGANNAAILAVQILALNNPELDSQLKIYKADLAERTFQQNLVLQQRLKS
jgi:5-(carboxyamino)imidazole ribonucleotide mutase